MSLKVPFSFVPFNLMLKLSSLFSDGIVYLSYHVAASHFPHYYVEKTEIFVAKFSKLKLQYDYYHSLALDLCFVLLLFPFGTNIFFLNLFKRIKLFLVLSFKLIFSLRSSILHITELAFYFYYSKSSQIYNTTHLSYS